MLCLYKLILGCGIIFFAFGIFWNLILLELIYIPFDNNFLFSMGGVKGRRKGRGGRRSPLLGGKLYNFISVRVETKTDPFRTIFGRDQYNIYEPFCKIPFNAPPPPPPPLHHHHHHRLGSDPTADPLPPPPHPPGYGPHSPV